MALPPWNIMFSPVPSPIVRAVFGVLSFPATILPPVQQGQHCPKADGIRQP
jgi:hypothetical protein